MGQRLLVQHEPLHLLQHLASLFTLRLRKLDILSQKLVEVYRLGIRERFFVRSTPAGGRTWRRGHANKLERNHFRRLEYNALLSRLRLGFR